MVFILEQNNCKTCRFNGNQHDRTSMCGDCWSQDREEYLHYTPAEGVETRNTLHVLVSLKVTVIIIDS